MDFYNGSMRGQGVTWTDKTLNPLISIILWDFSVCYKKQGGI